MMLVSGSNSQVEAISTYFLFLSFRSLGVVPRQHGHHHVRSELYTKSEANGRLFAHPSGHLIELTMLYRMVYLSYGFSVVFLFCHCKRTPMTTVTGRRALATAETSEENTKTEAT